MTQSQASPYMSSSYLYGVSSKGLHGISIHEREREAEKERRAQQLRNVESNSHPAHLFPQPIKIPPSKDDTLQKNIKATLGDFEVLAPSLTQKQQYSLLGIIPKVPQTPVESGNKVFSFDSTSEKKEHENEKTSSKSQKTLSATHQQRTKPTSLEEKPKTVEFDSKPSSKSSGTSKKPVTMETEVKGFHAVKALFMDEVKPKSSSSVKKEMKPISNDVNKSEHQKRVGDREEAKKHKSLKKESKDFASKPKPPKLSIINRTSAETTKEGTNVSGDTIRVEKILEEMTQPVAPPITAIHTPLKTKEKFAFPQTTSLSQHDSHNSIVHLNSQRNEVSTGLLTDLEISDDEPSSSEDSDSDSSDSESDSSDSDNSPPSSPAHTKSSELNKPSKGGLNHPDKKIIPTTTASISTTSCLTLNTTIGGDGLRGNQVAPPAHSSPLNCSSLNTEMSAAPSLDKELTDSLFHDDMHCFDALPELPDLSKDLLDGTVNTTCLDEILSNGLDNSQSSEPGKSNNEVTSHLLQSADKLPKGKDKLDDKESTKTLNCSKKLEKKNKHTREPGMKVSMEKSKKEQQDKPAKPCVKSKKSSYAVKLKSKDSIPSSKSLSNSNKIDSKNAKIDKPVEEKKSSKVKKTPLKLTVNGATEMPSKSSDGENEEVDVVTISNDKPFTNRTEASISQSKTSKSTDNPKNNNSTKSSNQNMTKSKTSSSAKTRHGRKEPSNGKMSPYNLSPKNGLSMDEITLDCNSKPEELVVKIPLALLRRIPHLNGSDAVAIKLENSEMLNEEHQQNGLSPARKAAKHHLSVECSESKKIKTEPELNGVIKKYKSNHNAKDITSRNESDKHAERRNSTSSTCSMDQEQNRRKRSPSRDSDWHHGKRRRHDSEGQRSERERPRSHDRDFETSCGKMNGWDRMKSKSPVEHSETCSCRGQEKDNKQKDLWITKLYEPEPRVLRGPDYYLHEAKRVKHHADAIKEYTPRAYKYFEAVLSFVQCGKALEQNNESESRSAYQMYVETIEMLKYAMRLSANRSNPEKNADKRFFGLCLRLQALLYMRLFKLRKGESMLKASKTLLEHFKGQVKMSQAPSPYNVSNPKTTGTPSPMSPTPSPSGSIGSVGSVGSTSSNEAMTTPSRTNKVSSNCMTSPVNATIPQKVQTMTYQHLGFTNHMLYGYDAWEQSQQIFNDHKDFFMDLDRKYGPITLHSPIVDVVEYVQQGYQRLKDST